MAGEAKKIVGKRVAHLRSEKGLSQAQLAEAMGVAVESISRIERSERNMSIDMLEKLCDALHISVTDFFEIGVLSKAESPMEKDIAKVVALLRSKKPSEIKFAYKILKDIFMELKKLD